MKNQKIISSIFKAYYTVTTGGFYTRDQLEKIMGLLAGATDCKERTKDLIEIVCEINENEFPAVADCQNALMFSALTGGLTEEAQLALRELANVLSTKKEEYAMTPHTWLKNLSKPNNEVSKSMLSYAYGDYEGAIDTLKRARADSAIIPIDESIAIIASEAQRHDLALEYAYRALYFENGIQLNHSYLKEIVNLSMAKLERSVADKIIDEATKSKKGKIGF